MNSKSRSTIRTLLSSLPLAALLTACATAPQIEERFSETSATTWRVAGSIMAFERTEARFSRSARDYVYLGPVAVNRRGSYEYLLWVGIGSTLDRGFLAPEASLPESLTLFIDDEPLELVVTDWQQRAPDLKGETPYVPPVDVEWQLGARVTLDQIELLNASGSDRLIVTTTEGDTREFSLWDDAASWQTFVAGSPL
jgi:hypothetical protein